MTNSQLKSAIQRLANVEVKTSTYKAGDLNFEGYASAYPPGSRCRVGVKTLYAGNSIADCSAYGLRTQQQATKAALINLSHHLELTDLAAECDGDNATENAADFAARTRSF